MATNTLGVYNPIFYAQEALVQLEEVMGLANRVYRGIEQERNAFRRGETVNIRRPSTFTAQNAPSTAQNITTDTVAITLSHWREVKFELTDKELSFTQERIVEDHIRPAARALASDVDQKLAALALDIPWRHQIAASTGATVSDITAARKILFDNKVPLTDGNLHMMIDGAVESEFLGLTAFSQQQGAGDAGINTQMRGSLGMKFGFDVFANQNTPAYTAGSITDGSSDAAVMGAVTAGDNTVTIDATSLTGTVEVGDILQFDGIDQQYVVRAAATASGNAITITFGVPGRSEGDDGALTDIGDGTAVTFVQTSSIGEGLAFHRNAFSLVMAPLSEIGDGAGARIATISDPFTGLSIRSRLYYDGANSAVNVALDILYGVKTLDANLATRFSNID